MKKPSQRILQSVGVLILFTACFFTYSCRAQSAQQVIRIARLTIDPAQLTAYNAALKEGIEAAIRLEPGVLTLYAVADKAKPENVTVFEIYASEEAYRSHLQTAHFMKYKTATAQMVKSLELSEVDLILLGKK